MRPSFLGRLAALCAPVSWIALTSGLVACNAIFGITAGRAGSGGAGAVTSSGAMVTTGTGAGGAPSCGGNPLDGHAASWAKDVGSEIVANAAAFLPGGGVVVAGSFADGDSDFHLVPLPYPTFDGGYGSSDLFVAIYGPAGQYQAAVAFNGPMNQIVSALAIDAGQNIYLGGSFQGSVTFGDVTLTSDASAASTAWDGFVAKLDPTGKPLWAKRVGTPADDEILSIALDPEGSVVLAGVTSGFVIGPSGTTGDFGCGPGTAVLPQGEVFLTKLTPEGAGQWCSGPYPVDNNYINYSNPASGLAVAVTPGGEVVLAGGFGGGQTTSFGQGQLQVPGESGFFLLETDAGGNYLWAGAYGGGEGTQWVTQVAVDHCGSIVLAGGFDTSVTVGSLSQTAPLDAASGETFDHMFVAKLTPGATTGSAPTPVWLNAYVDIGNQVPLALALDTAGDVALAGTLQDNMGSMGVDFGGGIVLPPSPPYQTGSFHPDAFVAKLSPAGKTLWASRYNGPRGSLGGGVALDDQGHTVVAGQFQDPTDFGTGTLTPTGSDLFVVKLGP